MTKVQQMAMALVGSALAILLAFGGVTAFAQTPTQDTTTPGTTTTTPTTPSVGGFGHGECGWGGAHTEYLADALGITVAELESAMAEARSAMIADAVVAGDITQAQADFIKARETVETYFDKTATYETREARQAAYEAAVQAALADGAITQAQADQLLTEGTRGPGGRPGRGNFTVPTTPDGTSNSGSITPDTGI